MRNEVIAVLLLATIMAGAGAGYLIGTSNQTATTLVSTIISLVTRSGYTETVTQTVTTTCSGYPPGGDCITSFSYPFTVTVNYAGPWRLSYQGYNSLGRLYPTNVSGSYSGTGLNSTIIILKGFSNSGLTLCAEAKKLDNSTLALTLTITGYNETTLPFGSVTYCGGVVP